MKITEIGKLKIGDWVLAGNNEMKGKFQVARVSGIEFDHLQDIDLNEGKISSEATGNIKENRHIYVFNKKELKALEILKNKLNVLNGLEDKPIKRSFR